MPGLGSVPTFPSMRGQGRRRRQGHLVAVGASLAAFASLALVSGASAASPRDVFVPTGLGNHVAYFPVGATTSNSLNISSVSASAITPDGGTAYVTQSTGNVVPINTAIPSAGSAFAVSSPTNIAVSPDGTKAYVGNGSASNVSVINTSNNSVTTMANGDEADRVAVSPDGTKLYVVTRASSSDVKSRLRIRATSDGSLIGNAIVVGTDFTTFSNAIAVAPDGNKLYIANNNGTVSVVDLTATPDPTVNNITGFNIPVALAITPDGSEVYVANSGNGTVSVIDTSTDTVETGTGLPITVGLNPAGIAITPDGNTAYVANSNASGPGAITVSVIDTATKTTGTAVPVGTFPGDNPQSVAIVPDQGPTASFTDTPAQAGSATSFDGSASSDPDGTVGQYDWDWGDGSQSLDAGPTPSHTYATGDTYNVTLTVIDNEGCSNVFVFTGQTAYCNPNTVSPAAKTSPVVIAGPSSPPAQTPATQTPAPSAGPTGQRAAALKKCKKKRGKARKKCVKKAQLLPV
jgi:YVTN family beta-propeller protein